MQAEVPTENALAEAEGDLVQQAGEISHSRTNDYAHAHVGENS